MSGDRHTSRVKEIVNIIKTVAMSFKEINDLRKSGRLQEALYMATAELNEEPDNIWAKRAAAWVYYAYIKSNCNPESFDVFVDYLQKIRNLVLDKDEAMLFDNCAWQVGSMVFSLKGKLCRLQE